MLALMIPLAWSLEQESVLEDRLMSSEPVIQIQALRTVSAIGVLTVEHQEALWKAPDLVVREALGDVLFAASDIEGLSRGWSGHLTDQERCRLALRLHKLGHTEVVDYASGDSETGPAWPVYSEGTFEDQWTCAIAGAELLGVSSPLKQLIQQGDFPLSMPFVWDVYHFLSAETLAVLEPHMEWVEEGLRAPLWTVMAIREPQWTSTYLTQLEDWSTGECLDAVDTLWTIGLDGNILDSEDEGSKRSALGLLSSVRRHSTDCGEWARFAKLSIKGRSPRTLKSMFVNIESQRDDLIGAFRVLASHPALSERQRKGVRKWVTPLMDRGLERPVLIELLRGIHLWAGPTEIEWLKALATSTTDVYILVEIEAAQTRLHLALN